MSALDEALTDDDLSDDGRAFATAYYSGRDDQSLYLDDYVDQFEDTESIYGVPDTWESYAAVAPFIASAFKRWTDAGKPEYLN